MQILKEFTISWVTEVLNLLSIFTEKDGRNACYSIGWAGGPWATFITRAKAALFPAVWGGCSFLPWDFGPRTR